MQNRGPLHGKDLSGSSTGRLTAAYVVFVQRFGILTETATARDFALQQPFFPWQNYFKYQLWYIT